MVAHTESSRSPTIEIDDSDDQITNGSAVEMTPSVTPTVEVNFALLIGVYVFVLLLWHEYDFCIVIPITKSLAAQAHTFARMQVAVD